MIPEENQDTTEEIEKYLTDSYNWRTYMELTVGNEVGLFEPLEFFKLHYKAFNLIILSDKHLSTLNTINNLLCNYSINSRYYFFVAIEDRLGNYIEKKQLHGDDKFELWSHIIFSEITTIESEFPKNRNFEIDAFNGYNKFNWPATIQKVAELSEYKDKIIYLSDISAQCEQYICDDRINPIEKKDHRNFIEKCSIEQKRLENNHRTTHLHATPITLEPSNFQLCKNNCSKIDFIRVINAMYELRFFIDDKELVPKKDSVMRAFGKLVGRDLSKYDSDLSQAFGNGSTENNVAIFHKLASATQKSVLKRLDQN